MGNKKVKPTEREVRLAKVISGLSLGVDALLRHRDKISEVLFEICEHIDESTEAAMVELEGLNRDLRESMPELFSGVEEPADCDEDSEESKPPLAVGQWVKVKKPNQEGTVHWNAEFMDKYDGGIFRVYHISPDHLVTGGLVYLEGAPWSFDPAWLTPLPDLPEGWRYLQPEELVAAGDECCALEYSRCADWWASGNIGRKQAAGGVYRRRTATEGKTEGKTEGETEGETEGKTEVAEAPKPAWEPKEGDWVTITKPADGGGLGWVSPFMDRYDGETFQFGGEFGQDAQVRRWPRGPGGYYFNEMWLKPWEPKEGEWVKVTKPETRRIVDRPSYVDSMDRYDGKVFQVCRVYHSRRVCDFEGHCWDFAFEWLSPAEPPVVVAEAPKPEQDKEIQPGTEVKILHPECSGRSGTTSWENCPIPDCLFVWVDSEDPVLRVGAIPIHKKWLSSAEAQEPQPEAPQKPVKAPVSAYHIGKHVLVTHRLKGFESSFVRILKGITIRKNRPDIVEYAVGRNPDDCFYRPGYDEILYINPDDPDSEYQIEPLDD